MTQNKLISSQTNAPYAGMCQHILNTYAYFVPAFYINAVQCFMRMSIYKERHTRTSVLVQWHLSCVLPTCCIVTLQPWLPLVYCQKQSHPRHTCTHLSFSAPKTYMCICASLWLKNKPISSQTRATYACTCVHTLICTCIRLITATVLDKCLHVCRAARLQDKMHSIISQCVRVQ